MGFGDKLASYIAWALAGTLFITVGWIALEPVDPLGPVSLVTGHGAAGMLVQASLLAVVAALIGTTIIGRKLPDAGTFAASLGLALVSLRGGTMEFLLVRTADRPDASIRGLALSLAAESLGWVVVVGFALVATAVASRWLFKPATSGEQNDLELIPAGWDIPLLGALLGRPKRLVGTSPADGLRHVIIGAVVMLAAHRLFATGVHDRVITNGQSCFVVAASVCTGVYFAYRYAPVGSALWPVLSACAYAFLGFLIAAVTASSSASASDWPVNVPKSHFLVALPVQSLGVGCAAAVASFWWRSAVDSMMRAANYTEQDRHVPARA